MTNAETDIQTGTCIHNLYNSTLYSIYQRQTYQNDLRSGSIGAEIYIAFKYPKT